MTTRKPYRTRQREIVLDVLKRLEGSYATIQEISAALEASGSKVGLSTLYRNLDRLESDGLISKVNIDGVNGACYRYLGDAGEDVVFSLKCESCGTMIDLDCPELGKLYRHLAVGHHFDINPGKTLFYGMCESCSRSKRPEQGIEGDRPSSGNRKE